MSSVADLLREEGLLWVGKIPATVAEAVEELAGRAREGDTTLQRLLGDLYSTGGKLVEQDHAEAFRWYRMAAEAGDADAQFICGCLCRDGTGIPQDKKEAALWFLKAARQGDTEAQYHLAVYALSCGHEWAAPDADPETVESEFDSCWTDEQQQEFINFLRTAAEGGYAEAQFQLGHSYEYGGGRPDADKAMAWYEKAAAQGLPHAIAAVKRLRR